MSQLSVQDIKIEDYNYPLPDERIARHPLAERDKCTSRATQLATDN